MRVELYGCVVGEFGYHFRFSVFVYPLIVNMHINIMGDKLLPNFGAKFQR